MVITLHEADARLTQERPDQAVHKLRVHIRHVRIDPRYDVPLQDVERLPERLALPDEGRPRLRQYLRMNIDRNPEVCRYLAGPVGRIRVDNNYLINHRRALHKRLFEHSYHPTDGLLFVQSGQANRDSYPTLALDVDQTLQVGEFISMERILGEPFIDQRRKGLGGRRIESGALTRRTNSWADRYARLYRKEGRSGGTRYTLSELTYVSRGLPTRAHDDQVIGGGGIADALDRVVTNTKGPHRYANVAPAGGIEPIE